MIFGPRSYIVNRGCLREEFEVSKVEEMMEDRSRSTDAEISASARRDRDTGGATEPKSFGLDHRRQLNDDDIARVSLTIVRGALVASIMSFCIAIIHFSLSGLSAAVGWILIVGALGFVLLPLVNRLSRDFVLMGFIAPIWGLALVTTVASVGGGLGSEALFWLPIIPLVAVMTCGPRRAVWVSGLCIAAIAYLGSLSFSNYAPAHFFLYISGLTAATLFSTAVAVIHDKQRSIVQKRLGYLATHHALTGLPSRPLFIHRLNEALAQQKRSDKRVGLLFIDLNAFKAINDTYGHHAGDEVLKGVARRLKETVRAGETPYHLSGDEFMVIIDDAKPLTLSAIATRVSHAIGATPLQWEAHALDISASIGHVIAELDDEVDSLVRRADAAMYRAKGRPRLETVRPAELS